MSDLVARLRNTPYQWEVGDLCDEAANALEAQAKRIAELERKLETASTNAVAEHVISSMEIAQGLQSDDPEIKVAAIERLFESFKPPQK